MVKLTINDRQYELDVPPDVPLLWVIRDHANLKGTKYGCGKGLCGACTVHLNGIAMRSCQISAGFAEGKKITTIEGIREDHPVKRAWVSEDVPQCGYCQPGQIMQAVSLLGEKPEASEQDIKSSMNGNLCRCGTYPRIRLAILRAREGDQK